MPGNSTILSVNHFNTGAQADYDPDDITKVIVSNLLQSLKLHYTAIKWITWYLWDVDTFYEMATNSSNW